MEAESFMVTVNSMRRSELIFNVTLPETRGSETVVTVIATSQGDSTVQAVANIRVGVLEKEVIPPRGDDKTDIVLVIEDTVSMGGESLMVANAIEALLGDSNEEEFPPD